MPWLSKRVRLSLLARHVSFLQSVRSFTVASSPAKDRPMIGKTCADPEGTAAMSRHATGNAQAVPSRSLDRLDAASATPKDGAR